VKVFSKSVLVLLALAVAGTPARSRSLHIAGTAGYLSEWQFDGEVAETATSGELVGPLVWKHIGLCSVNGPQEKPGKIHVRFSGAGSPSKIDATILFDSARCTYSGNLFGQLGRAHGLSRCWRNSSVDFNQVRPAAIKQFALDDGQRRRLLIRLR
jgi:hypothetical protein